ncbi:ADP-ribosylglycohydrolase family protein [Occultella kanbiaonis]|uniref:ADP-ribosylglycohydrolase family protein n=1 Tax=Occultella kanbiaonis TaxID=2675754 RepID=UPI0013D78F51|nr:ADP-ribosylglycohydrolase family protein [Occultella kanbiaonis]
MTSTTQVTDVLLDRAQGCLLGVALGDAMGMPGELWPRARVLAHFGWIDHFLAGPDGHFVVDGYQAGQVTDDTQQTMMLAEAILDAGGDVRAEVVARHLVDWADRVGASEGNFLGPSSARAIGKLRDGADPRTTGSGGETNGATMRIAPVGVVRASDDLEALVDAVVEATVMSHDTDVAVAGAALVAGVISAALDAPEGAGLDGLVETGYRAAEIGLGRGEKVVAASVIRRSEVARRIAEAATDDDSFLQELYETVGASVATSETVPAAIGLLVRGEGDPVRVAILAANLGGDTDTIGAIATGMAGAVSGASRIAPDLAGTLLSVNRIDPLGLAERLVTHRR